MAIVTEERWKEQVFMFTGKEFRATEIGFFPPSSSRVVMSNRIDCGKARQPQAAVLHHSLGLLQVRKKILRPH